MIAKAILVFIAMTATDLAWGVYVKSLADNKIIKAGVFSSLIMGFGATVTINYVGDIRMLIPAMIGAFVGTILSKYIKR